MQTKLNHAFTSVLCKETALHPKCLGEICKSHLESQALGKLQKGLLAQRSLISAGHAMVLPQGHCLFGTEGEVAV